MPDFKKTQHICMVMKILNFRLMFLAIVTSAAAACVNSKKFTSLRIIYNSESHISPGMELPFGVMAIGKNNKKILTKGYLNGKYSISKYHVEITHGSLIEENKAIIVIDSAESRELNRSLKVVVWPLKNPDLRDSVHIPFNYSGIYTWYFNGENGEDGDDKSGRVLPVRVGGTAISGGKTGENGKAGGSGESINVYVQKIRDDSFFSRHGYHAWAVTVKTVMGDFTRFTYIAERHGKLILQCNGGNGGEGGNGGRGPDGRDGDDRKLPGDGSNGGDGGDGGDGGNGGAVTVYLDSADKDFLEFLEIHNKGGFGGVGGKGGMAGRGGSGTDGTRARDGLQGRPGENGSNGNNGPNPIIVFREN